MVGNQSEGPKNIHLSLTVLRRVLVERQINVSLMNRLDGLKWENINSEPANTTCNQTDDCLFRVSVSKMIEVKVISVTKEIYQNSRQWYDIPFTRSRESD
jgi:hypothetical protein